MRISDWSSDVCSSDLLPLGHRQYLGGGRRLDPAPREMAEHDVPPAIEEVEVGLAAHIGGVARLQRRRMEGEVQYRQAQVDGDVDRPARALCRNALGRQRDPLGQAKPGKRRMAV